MIQCAFDPCKELPYHVMIDGLRGAATTPSGAVCAALSTGRKIPAGMCDRKEAARYVFWNYEVSRQWAKLIRILVTDRFP